MATHTANVKMIENGEEKINALIPNVSLIEFLSHRLHTILIVALLLASPNRHNQRVFSLTVKE